MYDFTANETRIYAPAESADVATEGYPQLTDANTGWTEEHLCGSGERLDASESWHSNW